MYFVLTFFPFLLSLLLVCLAAPAQVRNPRPYSPHTTSEQRPCCPHTTNDSLTTIHQTHAALAPARCLINDDCAIRVVALTDKLYCSDMSWLVTLHQVCLELIGRLPFVLPLYDVFCLVGDLPIAHARLKQHGACWVVTFSVTWANGWNLNKT